MPLIIPSGFAHAAWRWEMDGDPEYMVVTCGVQALNGGDFTQANAETTADAMLAAWPAAGMSARFRFRGVVVRYGSGGPPYSVVEAVRNVVGLGGLNILPQNCALLARKLTGSAGRRNRGRMYFPMLSVIETAVDHGGALDGPSQADFQARLNTLHGGLVSAGLNPYVLHSSSPTQVTVPGAPTAITSFGAEPRIATMRRRLRR